LIFAGISINSNYASKIEQSKNPNQLPAQLGNKTECGLLGFVEHLGGDYANIRSDNPTNQYVHVYTFNSGRKCMSTVIKHPTIPGGLRLFCKGASEMVLSKCKYMLKEEKIDDFTPISYSLVNKTIIEPMATNGLRTICVAYKDYVPADYKDKNKGDEILPDSFDWDGDEANITHGLTCICICGIQGKFNYSLKVTIVVECLLYGLEPEF